MLLAIRVSRVVVCGVGCLLVRYGVEKIVPFLHEGWVVAIGKHIKYNMRLTLNWQTHKNIYIVADCYKLTGFIYFHFRISVQRTVMFFWMVLLISYNSEA